MVPTCGEDLTSCLRHDRHVLDRFSPTFFFFFFFWINSYERCDSGNLLLRLGDLTWVLAFATVFVSPVL